jgi:hypothetical protein
MVIIGKKKIIPRRAVETPDRVRRSTVAIVSTTHLPHYFRPQIARSASEMLVKFAQSQTLMCNSSRVFDFGVSKIEQSKCAGWSKVWSPPAGHYGRR